MTPLEKLRERGEIKCIKCEWYYKDHVGIQSDGRCKLEIGKLYPRQIEAIEYWTDSKLTKITEYKWVKN